MDDLREQIRSHEGALEGLMRRIPGFAGYKDREERRQADQLHRSYTANALTAERERLADVAGVLMAGGSLAALPEVDRVRGQFDRVIDRIRHASYGYAGFFDAVRITEAELDRVYEYDLGLVDDVAGLGETITALAAAAEQKEGVSERLRDVEARLKAFDHKIDERTNLMTGVH